MAWPAHAKWRAPGTCPRRSLRPDNPRWHDCHVLIGEGSLRRSTPTAPWLRGESAGQGEEDGVSPMARGDAGFERRVSGSSGRSQRSVMAGDISYSMEGGLGGGVRHRLIWRRKARGRCSPSNGRRRSLWPLSMSSGTMFWTRCHPRCLGGGDAQLWVAPTWGEEGKVGKVLGGSMRRSREEMGRGAGLNAAR
jgi:hypothetical protein